MNHTNNPANHTTVSGLPLPDFLKTIARHPQDPINSRIYTSQNDHRVHYVLPQPGSFQIIVDNSAPASDFAEMIERWDHYMVLGMVETQTFIENFPRDLRARDYLGIIHNCW